MGAALLVHNGHHLLSLTVFVYHILNMKPNLVCHEVLDGRLIEVTTMGKLSLGRQKGSGRGGCITEI